MLRKTSLLACREELHGKSLVHHVAYLLNITSAIFTPTWNSKNNRTNSFQNLVTFVHDKVFDLVQFQSLFSKQTKHTSRCTNENVRRGVLQGLAVLCDWNTTVKNGCLYIQQVFTESLVFMCNLKRKFSCMTKHQNTDLTSNRLDLQRKYDEHIRILRSKAAFRTWCNVANTNTAVFPIPDLAWQIMSMPSTACGIHSCCTVQ